MHVLITLGSRSTLYVLIKAGGEGCERRGRGRCGRMRWICDWFQRGNCTWLPLMHTQGYLSSGGYCTERRDFKNNWLTTSRRAITREASADYHDNQG